MGTSEKEKHSKPAADRPKHKGGRPKLAVRREREMKIRLSNKEEFYIKMKAKQAGMQTSTWFRAAAQNAKIVPRLSVEDRGLLHMLTGIANNLNQLTKQANIGNLLIIARKCHELLGEIDNALKHFNRDDRQDT
ncbi:plasmid mobilization relaxosome protein MobC [uncultured Mucilaginibacter sp.]|uniref:plasmid mobilization protein n=1 Tax=uncultured Mucilaginibacter sp. TaxID=797541 RepID=UPI0026079689|nr:plasmid mobilization relaxosome protein MobC [uncultured Mucilaginibacter sp.]